MKIRLRYILLIAVFILGLGIVRNLNRAPVDLSSKAAPIQTLGYQEEDIRVVKAATQLRLGESGVISLQGVPGMKYTIKSSFVRGNRAFNVVQQRTADAKGRVNFTWTAARDTAPGVYPIVITGGAKTLNLYHTVLP